MLQVGIWCYTERDALRQIQCDAYLYIGMNLMSESTSTIQSGFKLPSTRREFWAMMAALGIVFLLVQVGAPVIRTFEFLDPKLREYFIGMSFAAFPFIHRGCKNQLSRFQAQDEPLLHDSAPWYVAGMIAGTVLYAWNQFVSLITGLALGISQAAYPDPLSLKLNIDEFASIQTTAALAVVLPLCAVASVYAGMLLNRHTRSNSFAALGVTALFFIAVNTLTTWAFQPAMMDQVISMIAQGGAIAAQVIFGMCLVAIIVLVFGSAGILTSRYYRERPLGMIVEAARKLPLGEREAFAQEIMRRINETEVKRAAQATPVVSSPPQMPTSAEP